MQGSSRRPSRFRPRQAGLKPAFPSKKRWHHGDRMQIRFGPAGFPVDGRPNCRMLNRSFTNWGHIGVLPDRDQAAGDRFIKHAIFTSYFGSRKEMRSYCTALASSGRRSKLIRIIGVTAAVSVWSMSAHAQINPFRGNKGPVLSKADLEQGEQAADKLLKSDEARVGASETWTGPTSGNSGTLTVQSAFERKGSTCRSLRSVVNYKNGTKRRLTLNVCRQPNGDWKIV
jgi:surface antigen